MTSNPHLEWLERKWDLSPGSPAAAKVVQLIAAEDSGSTACLLENEVDGWGNALSETTSDSPLVRVSYGGQQYLQSRRMFEAERQVAAAILAATKTLATVPDTRAILEIFPGATMEDNQPRAAQLALTKKLSAITGGPGTGKTYTLARILALLVNSGISPETIRLAAPTGKAADRMGKAVRDALEELPEKFFGVKESLLQTAARGSTLHALLGANPISGKFRHGPENPLHCEVLILDECSMVDLLTWQALFSALSESTRILMVGDPFQLESVGRGTVFAEIARLASKPDSPLNSCHTRLTQIRRFVEKQGILDFAKALQDGDGQSALQLLEQSKTAETNGGLAWIPIPEGGWNAETIPKSIIQALADAAASPDPGEALLAFSKISVLTAQRQYPAGALAIGRMIERHLAAQGLCVRNQPVIIDRNDPETGLQNGTVGIIHTSPSGIRTGVFTDSQRTTRSYPVPRLPAYSPAWAITIHRSQGSEYEEVLVLLPREESPLATRQLLYTAITRAKNKVTVAGDPAVVLKAAATPSSRTTLMAAAIEST